MYKMSRKIKFMFGKRVILNDFSILSVHLYLGLIQVLIVYLNDLMFSHQSDQKLLNTTCIQIIWMDVT